MEHKQLRAKTDNEWKSGLKQIKDKGIRAKVASLIWWDHISELNQDDYPYVNKVRDEPQEHDEAKEYEGLILCGYDDSRAYRRSRIGGGTYYNKA